MHIGGDSRFIPRGNRTNNLPFAILTPWGAILTILAHGLKCKAQVIILIMNHGCVLDVTCNKPIRVSSPIAFKIQLCLHYSRFAMYTAEFARAKTDCVSREEMDLLVHEVNVYTIIIFYMLILLFLLFGMFVCCCESLCVCNKQSVHVLCIRL